MSIITEFTVPAKAFALEHTLDAVADVTIEIERLATHSREWVMPFLWIYSDNLDSIETALRDDASVTDVTVLDRTDEFAYVNVYWAEPVQELVDHIVDRHGIMEEAGARDGTWYLRIRFIDRDALEDFQTYFHEQGYSFELHRLYDGSEPKKRKFGLTPVQYETLVTALEMGYFDIPRNAQIGELATELGVSTNAVSQRLRRATSNLTSNALDVSPPDTGRDTA
ncbi:helix-turn-helix domain-containing protein [Natronosalvus vescus]|uniref:helix-turn-helix domain-containing protein n=1 Tax=Natronosalvus vescus TaxID=2953881 RepID=UPI002090C97E|nr:helix-turn-helix domain-containing protein [Natronosalvus vescus]